MLKALLEATVASIRVRIPGTIREQSITVCPNSTSEITIVTFEAVAAFDSVSPRWLSPRFRGRLPE